MRKLKLFRTIEYLKTKDLFYDVEDVDDDIEGVLAYYGISENFTDSELYVIREELKDIIEQQEFIEAAHSAMYAEVI